MDRTEFKDHFSGHSEQYRRYRPEYPDTLFSYLASVAPDRQTAWDCATGTGQAAKALAACFATVIATDASAAQIANATRDRKILYRVEPSEKTSIGDRAVDLITVAQALHWFDSRVFFEEAKRVLKNKGVIAVWSYDLLRISPEIDAIIDVLYQQKIGEFWPPERRLIEDGYRSIAFPFEVVDSPEVSMFASWSFNQVVGYLETWSAVQKYKQAKGADPVVEVRGSLSEAWGEPGMLRKVVWPLTLKVGKYEI